jgi:Transposase and inactivated derivatives
MYFVGIDISKYKHDCAIIDSNNITIVSNFSFDNNQSGFSSFLDLLASLGDSSIFRIGFEATSHYHFNLMFFLENAGCLFMELNPLLVNKFASTQTIRKTKTDKSDALLIAKYLSICDFKPHPSRFYHTFALKSLSRKRSALIKQRTIYKIDLTNTLDIIFPEFKPFFGNKFSVTALFILNKYPSLSKIANMRDYSSIQKVSRGKFTYSKFLQLKQLAKDSIGFDNEIFSFQLETTLDLLNSLDNSISRIEAKLCESVDEINPKTLTIKGIGYITCAAIISEYGDFSRFKSADACLAFAGLDPAIYQSGTSEHFGKMVKRGSPHLRNALMQAAEGVFMHVPTFTDFYYKKKSEGKAHRVALSHLAKKLVRIIYKLETSNIDFDITELT